VHAVFSKNMFGPDSSSSLEISQIKELVRGVRYIEMSLSNIVDKNNTNANTNVKNMFGKSLSVNKSMKRGASITFDDLDAKKPAGRGIPACEFKRVLGKTLLTNLDRYQFLNTKDIE
jgi:N-acetylneuraminate synthase